MTTSVQIPHKTGDGPSDWQGGATVRFTKPFNQRVGWSPIGKFGNIGKASQPTGLSPPIGTIWQLVKLPPQDTT